MKILRALQTSPSMRRVIYNTGWSIGGSAMPMVAGLFAIPVLIRQIGTDRFGILMLAWALIGYLGLFDFGLGRAVTKFAADKAAMKQFHEIPAIFWDAVWVLAALGIVGGLVLAGLAPPIANTMLRIPAHLRAEVASTVLVIAIGVPLVTIGTGVRAIIEAQQLFTGISIIRAVAGVLGFVLPVAVLPYSCRLETLIGILVSLRLFMLFAFWLIAIRCVPGLSSIRAPRVAGLKSLLGFGGWVTISSVISPVLVYMDRFAVGAIVSVGAVTYYSIPYEMVTKLLILPIAFQTAVFPALSGSMAIQDSKTRDDLYKRTTELTIFALLPAILLVIVFSHEGLSMWLGSGIASHSYRVAQILALGVLVNGVAHMPSAVLLGSGRPDLGAKLRMIELPCYVGLCWILIRNFGIDGAALAWVFRAMLDAAALLYMAGGGYVSRWPWSISVTLAVFVVLSSAAILIMLSPSLTVRVGYLAVASAIILIAGLDRFYLQARANRLTAK